MIWRTALILIPVVFLAMATFRLLVQGEVERVVSIHVMDKAGHLLDMLTAGSDSIEDMYAAGTSPNFVEMARANHVGSLFFFNPDGAPAVHEDRVNALRAKAVDPDDQAARDDHSAHDEGGAHDVHDEGGAHDVHDDGGAHDVHDDHSEHAYPTDHADDGFAHFGHDHGSGGMEMLIEQIATVPPPTTKALRPLIEGGRGPVFSSGEIHSENGEKAVYGQVSLPAYSSSGAFLGIATFTLSATHIYSAMADSSRLFGVAFTLFGAVLFGVPALAFWLQKRLAERSARDLGYLSRHDALTGLLNRQTFSTEAQALLSKRHIGLVGYVDVDRFKLINDTYGHSVGDAFLKHIAKLLREALGEQALVARFGGDEFTFAMDRRDSRDAPAKVEKLCAEAAKEISIDGFSVASSISVGVTDTRSGDALDETLQRADMALYAAKSQGRNQVATYDDEMGEGARRRQRLEARLRDASAAGAFELAFQPLVNAQTGQTEGYEALLRLRCKDGRLIPPSDFIPLAEEIGLIEDIGKWVLFNGTQQISDFDDVSSVSINLSAEQFKSGKLVEHVKAALEQSGLPPHRLELEITESVLLQQDAHIEYQIDALKDMGATIAMDDFGTGFSSLSTLWRYGFDRIKIDKSFVHALEEAPERSQQLIDSIILLGARMGMSITAEGIETEAQRDLLRDLGCDILQGYFFGKPLPLQDQAEETQTRAGRAS